MYFRFDANHVITSWFIIVISVTRVCGFKQGREREREEIVIDQLSSFIIKQNSQYIF